jgi:hypothetical protein
MEYVAGFLFSSDGGKVALNVDQTLLLVGGMRLAERYSRDKMRRRTLR